MMTISHMPVIVGAGPAGIRAAQVLVQAGLRPILIDENPQPGGQIYRQQPPGFKRSARARYGFEHRKASDLHSTAHALIAANLIDYRPETLVWDADGESLYLSRDGRHDTIPYQTMLLATGATDRILPFPGWTLPGVYTLGGAQIALKYQGCAIGRKVVFAGTGPLLYLVAYQYCMAGVQVAAVLDTSPFPRARLALRGLAADPRLMAKGMYYMARLRMRGVPITHGVAAFNASGQDSVTGVQWTIGQDAQARTQTMSCDALACGFGLRSENQLAALLGCDFIFNEQDCAWQAKTDDCGRSSQGNIFLAGDGMCIGGADMAELTGIRAAYQMLSALGVAHDERHARRTAEKIAQGRKTRIAIDKMFPLPERWMAAAEDALLLCRCEEIRVGDVRSVLHTDGEAGLNRIKALTRVGMGRCQGRMCGSALSLLLAQEQGVCLPQIERLRNQPPVKPIGIGISICKR